MLEPGLDIHEWTTELSALEDELEEAPARTLPQLADLVERMLRARGYDLDDPVAASGDDRDVVTELRAAREVADAAERGDDDAAGPGDVADAVNGLRDLARFVLEERAA